ncbi:MAG: MATE family efflux transporter [Saccharospirillaceae bacterium]|nr:MATE family efflux transporter [Pseudomonadales bacterium]NRB80429.1 MATE family efflux transporter [Saccharospirillaceae bacterium]
MLANLATPLLAMADAAILGHLPNVSFLAALSIASGIFAYILWGFNCISLSCSTFTGNANASNDSQLINNRLYQYVFIAFITSIILFIILQLSIDPLLSLINISENLKKHVLTYLKIMSFSIMPLLFIQVAISWFTGLKQPKIALYVLLISSSINIVLDIIFVFILNMDINGVALASVIAQFITALFVFLFILNYQKNNLSINNINRSIWLNNEKVFSFGGTLLLRSGVLLSVFLLFNLKGASISENTVAANALLMTILILISSVLDATASSAQVQLANKSLKQHSILSSTFFIMSLFVLGFILVIFIFGHYYLTLMSNQSTVILLAGEYLPWMVLLCITSCSSYWLDGVFLGWHKSKWMRNSVLISACLVYFPLLLNFDLSNHQLWLSLNVFMIIRSLCMWFYFIKKTKYS